MKFGHQSDELLAASARRALAGRGRAPFVNVAGVHNRRVRQREQRLRDAVAGRAGITALEVRAPAIPPIQGLM
jgi:hypothetical protein